MHTIGAQRTAKRNRDAVAKDQGTRSVAGKRMLQELPALVNKAIEDWIAQAQAAPGRRHNALAMISKFDIPMMSSLALKTVIDSLCQSRAYTATAVAIGNRLEDEERYQSFVRQQKISFEAAKDRCQDYTAYGRKRRHILTAMSYLSLEVPTWTLHEKTSVGVVLLDLIAQSTGIIEVYYKKTRGKDQLNIRATPEAMQWFENVNEESELWYPMYLPFVEEPLDWVNPMSGGFHSTNCRTSALVKTYDREFIKQLGTAQIPEVYSSLNSLQRTKWSVNEKVWEVFSYLWENALPASSLPIRDNMDVPPKPANIDDPEVRREWRKSAREVHDANHRRQSERLTAAKIYWVTKRYLNQTFWFCYQLDWRGRAYPISYYLHPQGGDLSKGLLQFTESKGITSPEAIHWFLIHGANLWGKDKCSFDERKQWVAENHDWLVRIASDPLDCRDWEDADKPWQFLAWVMDWFDWQSDPDGHRSSLPIHQDATQSGMQIYSLMLRDVEGATNTNCVPSDTPQDLYAAVADRANEILRGIDEPWARYWLQFGVDRQACKRPVMTAVYNATKFSATHYVGDWARAEAHKRGIDYRQEAGPKAVQKLTAVILQALGERVQAARTAQAWLSQVAGIFASHRRPILWTSPVGFPVRQFYKNYKSHSVKTLIGEIYRQTSVLVEQPGIDSRRMKSAFAPNVIHSLDAAAMMRTIVLASQMGVSSFSAVHDSFATLAADSECLSRAVRESYISLFREDRLAALRDELQAQVPETELPELPPYGSLDVSELRNSPYFFS